MKLYQFAWGPYPRRVHIYLAEKGIADLELVDVDVIAGEQRKPEFLAKNPAGTVPALETDSGACIGQSVAVLEYLEARYDGPNLLGSTDEQVARTRALASLVHEAYVFAGECTYHASPAFAQLVRQSPVVAGEMHAKAGRLLGVVDAMVGEQPYLGGGQPSIADIVFFATEQYMRSLYRMPLPADLVNLEAVYRRFAKRSSAAPVQYPKRLVELAPVRLSSQR